MSQGRPSKRKRSTFGQRLFELRVASGVTQGEVAEALGISQSAYSDWECGWVAIHPDRLKALADILGTSVTELFGGAKPRQLGNVHKGRLARTFEAISKLPLRQQNRIMDHIDALIARLSVDAS